MGTILIGVCQILLLVLACWVRLVLGVPDSALAATSV